MLEAKTYLGSGVFSATHPYANHIRELECTAHAMLIGGTRMAQYTGPHRTLDEWNEVAASLLETKYWRQPEFRKILFMRTPTRIPAGDIHFGLKPEQPAIGITILDWRIEVDANLVFVDVVATIATKSDMYGWMTPADQLVRYDIRIGTSEQSRSGDQTY